MTHQVPPGIALATHVASLKSNPHNITVYTIQEMKDSILGLPKEYSVTPQLNFFPDAPTDVPLLWYCAHESMFEHGGRRLGKLCSLISCELMIHMIRNAPGFMEGWTSPITGSADVKFLEIVSHLGTPADGSGWDFSLDVEMGF